MEQERRLVESTDALSGQHKLRLRVFGINLIGLSAMGTFLFFYFSLAHLHIRRTVISLWTPPPPSDQISSILAAISGGGNWVLKNQLVL